MYDKNGHLCPFDENLIEQNKLLYFSGYIKPIFDEDPSPDSGIPAHDMGPINAWYKLKCLLYNCYVKMVCSFRFLSGFDGGEKANVSFTTAYGEYYIMEPSPDYLPLMKHTITKIKLSKMIIEFLAEEAWQNPSYEDLLQKITASGELDEEALIRHAQFICDQVRK